MRLELQRRQRVRREDGFGGDQRRHGDLPDQRLRREQPRPLGPDDDQGASDQRGLPPGPPVVAEQRPVIGG